jgi:uncharacterized protein YcaQ
LEQLYTDGELIIHHKQGSRKYYDLANKYIPSSILKADNPCKSEESFINWRIYRRIGAVGLLWDKNSTAFLGLNINAETRKTALTRLTNERKICPVMVEGIKSTFYYLADDDSLMQKIINEEADIKPRMSFLAPLDPIMWDKALILALWNYQYAWEIYTPVSKRKYGYYTLPILFGEKFVGRIEIIADHKENILRIKNIWWEPEIKQTKKLEATLNRTLNAFCRFNDCNEVSM